MTKNIKNYVIQELEAYPRILRQISVLRYEMEHPAHVSAQEMLDAMTYACGDRTGSSPGHVSDKTFYIAMNYRQKAAAANSEISEEISAKLRLSVFKSIMALKVLPKIYDSISKA